MLVKHLRVVVVILCMDNTIQGDDDYAESYGR